MLPPFPFNWPPPWSVHISEFPVVFIKVYTAFMAVLICRTVKMGHCQHLPVSHPNKKITSPEGKLKPLWWCFALCWKQIHWPMEATTSAKKIILLSDEKTANIDLCSILSWCMCSDNICLIPSYIYLSHWRKTTTNGLLFMSSFDGNFWLKSMTVKKTSGNFSQFFVEIFHLFHLGLLTQCYLKCLDELSSPFHGSKLVSSVTSQGETGIFLTPCVQQSLQLHIITFDIWADALCLVIKEILICMGLTCLWGTGGLLKDREAKEMNELFIFVSWRELTNNLEDMTEGRVWVLELVCLHKTVSNK